MPCDTGSQTSGLQDPERVRVGGVQAPGLWGLVTAAAGAQADSFACPQGQNGDSGRRVGPQSLS